MAQILNNKKKIKKIIPHCRNSSKFLSKKS